MHSLRLICLTVGAVCLLIVFEGAACASETEETVLMRGRVTFPGGSRTPIDRNATLTIELQDTSLADAAAKVIARGKGQVRRFPIAFAVKYRSAQIIDGHTYSMSVMIRNGKNELLYINDVYTPVTLLGEERTKFIEVPVILIKSESCSSLKLIRERSMMCMFSENTPAPPKTTWPELVGAKGENAVKIIKQQTGRMTMRRGPSDFR